MQALEIRNNQLVPVERPLPMPTAGEVRIKVAAAGLNRADIFQRQGSYAPPLGITDIPGLEVAGVIDATGEGVTSWKVGDKVCALLAGGGYAEYATAPAEQLFSISNGLTFEQAAALPEACVTAWMVLVELAHLQPSERVMVHGGASGIGTTAIQIAKALGAMVYTTAGTQEKCSRCEELGATRAINYRSEDFVQVIQEITQGKGVDVVLDMVGGDYFQRNLKILAARGRMVSIAFLQSAKAEINFASVLMKNLTLVGATLRNRSLEEKGRMVKALQERIWPLIKDGTIRPVIDSVYPFKQAPQAQERMERYEHMGKIVLKW